MNPHRILQGIALTSALALGAGYVWWAQHQANHPAAAASPEASPPAPEQPVESIVIDPSVQFATPVFNANGLALSSKSISMPVFSTRQEATGESAPPSGEPLPPAIAPPVSRVFDGSSMIRGSKSFGRPLDLPVSGGKGFSDWTRAAPADQQTRPSENTAIPPLLRRDQRDGS